MSKTITLPDHISFEEIAAKWCEVLDGLNVLPSTGMTFVRFEEEEIGNHFVEYDCITDEGHVGQGIIADYCPSDRKLLIRDEEKFQPILDYIKERSNSNHEITIPDHIRFEEIALKWCDLDFHNDSDFKELEHVLSFKGNTILLCVLAKAKRGGHYLNLVAQICNQKLTCERVFQTEQEIDSLKKLLNFIKERSNG